MALQDVGVLSKLTFHRTTWRRNLKGAAAQVAAQFGADEKGLSVGAYLLPEEYRSPVNKVVNEARGWWKANTVPWIEEGKRFLPVARIAVARATVDDYTRQYSEAFMPLYNNWQQIRTEVTNLGELGTVELPPSPEFLLHVFRVEFWMQPLPELERWGDVLGADFDDALKQEVAAGLDEQYAEATAALKADLYARLTEPLQKLADKLVEIDADPEKRLVTPVLTNIVEAAKVVAGLNADLTNDPLVQTLADLAANVGGASRACLAESSAMRTAVGSQVNSLIGMIARAAEA